MVSKSQRLLLAAFAMASLAAFSVGLYVEGRVHSGTTAANLESRPSPLPAGEPRAPSYQQLAAADIVALPFADFYEALRSAPEVAREKWASELNAMPEGPRRTAAVSGFYKLLVQFDPDAAISAIGKMNDSVLQNVALGAAVNAAPGFALPKMADLSLSLQSRTSISSKRDYLSDVMGEWMVMDPAGAARFININPEAFDILEYTGRFYSVRLPLITTWASVDPRAAREWMEKRGDWEEGWETREAFVDGWYQSNRAEALSYTLAHVQELYMEPAIGTIVRNLYLDSTDEATRFILALPEEKRAVAFTEAFRNHFLLEEEETGESAQTPRAIASWMAEFPPDYWKGAIWPLFGFSPEGPGGMLGWIEQLPPAIREAAAAEYVAPSEKSASEKIMPLLQVADPVLRDQLFRAVLNNQSLELKEAVTAVTGSPISSEQKHHLLQVMAAVEAEKGNQGSEK